MKALLQRLSILHALLLVAAVSLTPAKADAFCGFYVSGASDNLYNDASQVVMMRQGTQTILSMRNTYQGPPEDFALVVPVPQILKKEHVQTLDDKLFDHITTLTAPRLVEYWEQKSCRERQVHLEALNMDSMSGAVKPTTPTVVSRFAVGEYEVVVLSAAESNGLEKWLLANKYNIPKGASAALAPYIAQGMYFFVAKVNASKVKFDAKGNALLSPLRFHYKSEDFSLPVRLGLLNAKGPQDLLVHILSREGRYRVANYPNVAIPTNLIVPAKLKEDFAAFYEALFSYTLARRPGAVVTEYVWSPGKCDPCTAEPLEAAQLFAFGTDILDGTRKVVEVSVVEVDIKPSTPTNHDSDNIPKLENKVRSLAFKPWARCLLPFRERLPKDGKITITYKTTYPPQRFPKSDVTLLDHSFGDEAFAECLTASINHPALMPTLTPKTIYTVRAQIKAKKGHAPTKAVTPSWSITRLHARYDSKSLGEDLIFERAPGISGGRGMPYGDDGALRSTPGVQSSKRNMFQARYIILNHMEEPICREDQPTDLHWGGTPRGKSSAKPTTATTSSTKKRGRHKLSKDIEAQVRQQLEAQKKVAP